MMITRTLKKHQTTIAMTKHQNDQQKNGFHERYQ